MVTITHGPSAGLGEQVVCGGGGGEQNYIRSIDEQWNWIENKHPGLMKHLYDNLVSSFTGDASRRSLLSDIRGKCGPESDILTELIGESPDHYTEKINSFFLSRFKTGQTTTDAHLGPYDPIYVRLAATGADVAEVATASSDPPTNFGFGGEDVRMSEREEKTKVERDPLASKKSLQLVLAYNYFTGGGSIKLGKAFEMLIGDVTKKMSTPSVFSTLRNTFDSLFGFFQRYETGITVQVVDEGRLSSGGNIDFGVLVSGSMIRGGHSEPVKEYAAIVEFKRPNSGVGIAWKLLNGQGWTPAERSAFFKLRDLSPFAFDDQEAVEAELNTWPNYHSAAWKAAEEVLERIGSRRVEVKYSTGSRASLSHPGTNNATEYFVDGDDGPEDITGLLTASKFKDCFDCSLNAVAHVTTHAAPNGCTRVAIADTLTVITGSVSKLEKSTDLHTNPGNDDDVLDVHLHDTAMLQTHDKDSAVYMLEYLCEATMSNTMARGVGDELLTAAGNTYQSRERTVEGVKRVRRQMAQRDIFAFNSRDHSSKDLTLVESSKLLAVKTRAHIQKLLADFKEWFPKIKSRAANFTSDTFVILEWFREIDFKDFGIYDPWDGRSKSVAKVQKRGKDDEKFYVLKEYFADELSVSRMSDELEAYSRISKLPRNEKKYFAQLVSFGSLDLDTANPRLYLLLEYVEDFDADDMGSIREEEVEYVDKLLRDVGIRHNDIQALNYRWQLQPGGNWYIKVFNIDGVTYFDNSMMKQK